MSESAARVRALLLGFLKLGGSDELDAFGKLGVSAVETLRKDVFQTGKRPSRDDAPIRAALDRDFDFARPGVRTRLDVYQNEDGSPGAVYRVELDGSKPGTVHMFARDTGAHPALSVPWTLVDKNAD